MCTWIPKSRHLAKSNIFKSNCKAWEYKTWTHHHTWPNLNSCLLVSILWFTKLFLSVVYECKKAAMLAYQSTLHLIIHQNYTLSFLPKIDNCVISQRYKRTLMEISRVPTDTLLNIKTSNINKNIRYLPKI